MITEDEVGEVVIRFVGDNVTDLEGKVEGWEVCFTVGDNVGTRVGTVVGDLTVTVGTAVGDLTIAALGEVLGTDVRVAVDTTVGVAVGTLRGTALGEVL